MRVPRMHLGHERAGNIANAEGAAVFGHRRVKEHLQEQVTQFVA
jgi:hypothetical protein